MNIRSGNFNPLPPHGGRRVYLDRRKTKWKFQSTPSAWRETRLVIIPFNARFTFQSTPSAWRETAVLQSPLYGFYISIHSLRMEGDFVTLFYFHLCTSHFNPLPPHGGRHHPVLCQYASPQISIHSLRMEGDSVLLAMICTISSYFNPLPPHGGRPVYACYL